MSINTLRHAIDSCLASDFFKNGYPGRGIHSVLLKRIYVDLEKFNPSLSVKHLWNDNQSDWLKAYIQKRAIVDGMHTCAKWTIKQLLSNFNLGMQEELYDYLILLKEIDQFKEFLLYRFTYSHQDLLPRIIDFEPLKLKIGQGSKNKRDQLKFILSSMDLVSLIVSYDSDQAILTLISEMFK
jgi:hypothetical protein